MKLIRDDPIVRSMEQTGYPPWWHQSDYPDSMFGDDEDDEWEGDGDVYFGNETSSF